MPAKTIPGRAGERIEVHSPGGGPPRRGLILEVLGATGHEHYRVRWTDEHESIYYPADGSGDHSAWRRRRASLTPGRAGMTADAAISAAAARAGATSR